MEIKKPTIVYAPIHRNVSREVLNSDLPRVYEDAKKMAEMCRTEHGFYKEAYAIAHSQLTDEDPLRFFVDIQGRVFINPEIIRHTRHTVPRLEGCMSFPQTMNTVVQRWTKLDVKYLAFPQSVGLMEEAPGWPELTTHTDSVKGVAAQIVQHEIDHMNAKYIFTK